MSSEDDVNQGGNDVPVYQGAPDPEEQLRQLVDTALDAVVTCDTKSRILVWNSGAERLFGWSAEEAIGMLLAETIIPEEMREAHNRGMAHYLQTGDGPVLGQRIEVEAMDRSGRRFPVELSINPIQTPEGLSFSGFIRDISDRIESERKIREGEERLKLIFDAADEGVWDLRFSLEGSVIDSVFGDRTRDLLGENAGGIPPNRTCICDEDRPLVEQAWADHWDGKTDNFELEYRIAGKEDSEYRWVRERGTIVRRHEDGVPERAVGSVVDITVRRRLEAALLAAQKGEALGLLAGGFAHDLNNILAAIQGHASLLRMFGTNQEKIEESVQVIELAVTRGKSLTRNMLQLGRPTQIRKKTVGFVAVVKEAMEMISPALPKTITVDLEVEFQGDVHVHLSPEQLQQALLNLVINSRDSMPTGGELVIRVGVRSVQPNKSKVGVIQVADTGCGIPEEDQENVLQPFFSTKGAMGTGLGLAIVQGFVLDNDGTLRIESGEGKGTTIEMEIPLVSGVIEKSDKALGSSGSSEKYRVLLAEDHPLLRPILKEAIELSGHHVEVASDGAEAESLGTQNRPDIMVMDIDLPISCGDVIAQHLRTVWEAEIPVIFITGNTDFIDPGLPSSQLLRKPFDIEDLAEVIMDLMSNS